MDFIFDCGKSHNTQDSGMERLVLPHRYLVSRFVNFGMTLTPQCSRAIFVVFEITAIL